MTTFDGNSQLVLLCDEEHCGSHMTGGASNGYRPSRNTEEARSLGREEGWTYVDDQDLCPRHSE